MMKKYIALLLCIAMLGSLLCACTSESDVADTIPIQRTSSTEESTTLPTETEEPATESPEPVSTYEQGILTEERYYSKWLNLSCYFSSYLIPADITEIKINNIVSMASNPDNYGTIEMVAGDTFAGSDYSFGLYTFKLTDNQKNVEELALEFNQTYTKSLQAELSNVASAEFQWDSAKQLLFLGETYLAYHLRSTVYDYLNMTEQSDMEYWRLYRIKEDRLIVFTFADTYGNRTLSDLLSPFTAYDGGFPTTACVENSRWSGLPDNHNIPSIYIFGSYDTFDACYNTNETIYDDISPYLTDEWETSYTWTVQEDIISLCFLAESVYVSEQVYFVYNISLTGELISKEDFMAQCDLSDEEYLQLLKDALTAKFYELYGDFDTSSEFFQNTLAWTISEETMAQAQPFYSAENGLCVVANVGSLVGADAYDRIVSLSQTDT